MQDTTAQQDSPLTVLTAINIAKALTIVLLIGYALWFGIQDIRQLLYLCLHITYCFWWLVEQWFFPLRRQQIFTEPTNLPGLVFILLFVGGLYSLPGYLAFTNSQPISYLTVAIALPLYILGSLINATADVQKLTAKQHGATLVSDQIWRLSRNINYLGDLLRYLSFSIVSGSLWAYLLPGIVALLYLQRIAQKEQSMAEKYPDFATYQQSSTRLIPFIW